MKTIYLVRHGRSSHPIFGQKDHERPLLHLGVEEVNKVGKFLSANGIKPALIISSHAVRAFETASLLAERMKISAGGLQQDQAIYLGDEDSLIDLIFSLPQDLESVMLVGHNPTITGLARTLLVRLRKELSTSSVVSISFATDDWTRILISDNKLNFIVYPGML